MIKREVFENNGWNQIKFTAVKIRKTILHPNFELSRINYSYNFIKKH
jgi:hypothetical protein